MKDDLMFSNSTLAKKIHSSRGEAGYENNNSDTSSCQDPLGLNEILGDQKPKKNITIQNSYNPELGG